jgi:hypothetical protein
MTTSSLRAFIKFDCLFTKFVMPAPRSNLLSLNNFSEGFKDNKISSLQSQSREIASSFVYLQTVGQLYLTANQSTKTLLAMTSESPEGVRGQFSESF